MDDEYKHPKMPLYEERMKMTEEQAMIAMRKWRWDMLRYMWKQFDGAKKGEEPSLELKHSMIDMQLNVMRDAKERWLKTVQSKLN